MEAEHPPRQKSVWVVTALTTCVVGTSTHITIASIHNNGCAGGGCGYQRGREKQRRLLATWATNKGEKAAYLRRQKNRCFCNGSKFIHFVVGTLPPTFLPALYTQQRRRNGMYLLYQRGNIVRLIYYFNFSSISLSDS